MTLRVSQDFLQRGTQLRHRSVHVVQLLQPKQPPAEGAEIGRLITLQGHASSRLQALGQKLLARL
jgi:hypothetical protein